MVKREWLRDLVYFLKIDFRESTEMRDVGMCVAAGTDPLAKAAEIGIFVS